MSSILRGGVLVSELLFLPELFVVLPGTTQSQTFVVGGSLSKVTTFRAWSLGYSVCSCSSSSVGFLCIACVLSLLFIRPYVSD